MKSFFRKWRKENLNNLGKYILYAIGELVLIIVGILIAININERQTIKKNNVLRCQYLDELSFALSHDIEDIENNIEAFEYRNPKVKKLINAISDNKLTELDSLTDKVNTLSKYVFFVQQSTSKIDELKYSSVNLITNRSLKNRILLYQESKMTFLLDQERRFNKVNEEVTKYFHKMFSVIDIDKLKNDSEFASIAYQKYNASEGMRMNYEDILIEQKEIKQLIEKELAEKCKS